MNMMASLNTPSATMDLLAAGNLVLALLLGAGLGFFGGVFGIGGGIIAIPLLVLGFAMAQPLAQGTALVLMVPNLLVGWWRYRQHHPLPWPAMAAIAVPATLTTWFVAGFATRLDPLLLRLVFCAFLAFLGVKLLLGRKRAVEDGRPLPLHMLPLVGIAGGSSMGLLGIGGGLVASPLLSGWLGQRQAVAQGLALALVAPSSVVALASYALAGQVNWRLGLPLALGGLFTVSAGVALAHRLPERRMRSAFAWMLLATAGWLAVGRYLLK